MAHNHKAMILEALEQGPSATVEVLKRILSEDIKIKVAGVDIDGVHRGKIISKDKFFSAIKSDGFGFCSVVFGWDLHDRPYAANEGEGYSDLVAKIDLSSFRRIPWEHNIPFFLIDFCTPRSNEPLAYCPRGLLKRVLSSAENVAYAGMEFEWFNFQESPESLREKSYGGLKALTPGMFGYSLLRPTLHQNYFNDIYDQCTLLGIEIEGFHTETGPGVYEAALKYNKALLMADSAQLFKTSVKQLGLLQPKRHNSVAIYPSFMAKPSSDLPGCSGHVHLSLFDKEGNNLFYDAADKDGMSSMFKQFVAGLMNALPSLMPIFAPNINSYKRFSGNFWAPLTVSWGVEDRLSAIRIITPKSTTCCSASGTRAELRVPGADVNAYLVLAAAFAAGIYGITNKLDLSSQVGGSMPKTLKDAIAQMESSELPVKLFGNDFVEHYIMTRKEEWQRWESSVTTWETQRYFELV